MLPSLLKSTVSTDCKHELTMAMSWELLAWAMPRILVVCITSTEKLGSQLAMRDPVRECMNFMNYCDTVYHCQVNPQSDLSSDSCLTDLPSKWKKWLCWLICGLASGAAPAGPVLSSKPPPCCWPLVWPPSPLMFRDVRHVGQEVSCSSHERKQELEKHTKKKTNVIMAFPCIKAWH